MRLAYIILALVNCNRLKGSADKAVSSIHCTCTYVCVCILYIHMY